jgi:hypothetical protein
MSANDRQVGGSHYNNSLGYPHWDMCANINAGYFEGQATKYLARFRTSGKFMQDLEKAKHYTEKLLECSQIISTVGRRHRHWVQQEVGQFCRVNGIVGRHRHVFFVILNWNVKADLIIARDIIQEFIEHPEQFESCVNVPLTDSNKHAERA